MMTIVQSTSQVYGRRCIVRSSSMRSRFGRLVCTSVGFGGAAPRFQTCRRGAGQRCRGAGTERLRVVLARRVVPAWSAALVFWRHDVTRDVVDFVLANFFYIWHSARHRRAPRGR